MASKDLSYYRKRLSKQKLKIEKVEIKIEKYFQDSFQKCANLDFTDDVLNTFKSVIGRSEDAAMEMHHRIDKDIETLHNFLNKWEIFPDIDKKTMKLAKRLHHEHVQFKSLFEETPPDMIAGVKDIIMQKRWRGY
jgi:hypothetical protein